MRFIYLGDSPTIHPQLGQLEPGENEHADGAAIERVVASGSPLFTLTRQADGATWDDKAGAWVRPTNNPAPARAGKKEKE